MDLSYLLFLQNFRHSINDAWTPFLESLSLFAVTYLICIPVFIYWCINKRKGLFALAAYNVCVAVNAVIKLTACVYRPWIRDVRIVPAGNAIETATGYSFPSGHTTTAVPLYGGMAIGFWESKKTRWLAVLCVILILLTGFSRNYLGVHTPQDVGVGMVLGILSLWMVWKLAAYLEKYPEKENRWLAAGLILSVLALIYITYKPYPLDYVNGKLLVDPQRMMNDGYKDIGSLMGFCIGRYIEKKWVRFDVLGFSVKGVCISAIGLGLAVYMNLCLKQYLVACLGVHWGGFTAQAFLMIYFIALFPFLFKFFSKRQA